MGSLWSITDKDTDLMTIFLLEKIKTLKEITIQDFNVIIRDMTK